jgi:hypothetical protein
MKTDRFDCLITFLRQLDEAGIHYELDHYREDAVSVRVSVPGERWEVDFLQDGGVDVERFRSDGSIGDESLLDDLFARFSDKEPVTSHDSRPGK